MKNAINDEQLEAELDKFFDSEMVRVSLKPIEVYMILLALRDVVDDKSTYPAIAGEARELLSNLTTENISKEFALLRRSLL